jgi:hypothetical protein
MKGRCNRCGMEIDCTPYEDQWLCQDCLLEVEDEVTLNDLKSGSAGTSNCQSFRTAPPAFQKRIRTHIKDMEYQAADCLRQLKALRAEEE